MKSKTTLAFSIAVAFVLSIASAQVEAYPAAGYDEVSTTAQLILADPADSSIDLDTVTLVGRAVILRGDPYDPGDGRIKIDTRLDTLILRGFSSLFGDSIFATLNRDTVSKGCIQQVTAGVDFPAESFFDVFYVISIGTIPNPPSGPGGSNSGAGLRGGLKLGKIGGSASATFSEPLFVGRGGSRSPNPATSPIQGNLVRITPFGEGALSKVATACDAEWHGAPFWIIQNWFEGDEVYASYQDPIETGCVNTYPFLVESVTWIVTNQTGAPLDVIMQPVVYEVLVINQCLIPGQPICVGDSFLVTLPEGGVIVTLPITCCVDSPYFIGIITPDFIGDGLLDIVTDSVVTPARLCASYNDWGPGWKDLADTPYDFPGNLKLWSDGLASDMNNCGQVRYINIDPPHLTDTIWQIPPVGRQYQDPRKVAIIDPLTGDTIAWVFHKHKIDPPDSGTDTLTTWGFMDIWIGPDPPEPSQQPDDQIMLEGTAIIRRGPVFTEGGDAGFIQTEILEMSLTGVSPTFGPAILSLPQPAPGSAQSTGPELFPMDNFFDVFYRVEFPELGQSIEPLQAPQMQAQILSVCPAYDAQYEDPNGPHPIHDPDNNPGQIIGWVLPVHIVHTPPQEPPDSGACCDPLGRCRQTTQGECENAGDTYLGDGVLCVDVICDQPPEEWFESIAQGTITFDPLDTNCLNGTFVALSSVSSKPSIIKVGPPPYTTGTDIPTEMVQLELAGTHPIMGPITVRERADKLSDGKVTNVTATGGAFDLGDSFFDIFFEIEISGQIYNTKDIPVRVESQGITELPPFGSDYIPPPNGPQSAPLFDANGVHVGWYCHNMHRPTIPVPCDVNDPNDRPTGACCDTLGNCIETTEGKCEADGGYYYGDGTSCNNVVCPPEQDRDCFESIGKGTITLDPTDNQCLTGATINLSSGFKTADVDVDPGPYSDGQIIQTEIVAMTLSGFDPVLVSDVIIRERSDKASKGKITDVLTSGGILISGKSKFDVYIEVEIVALSLIANTGNIPFVLEAEISSLPPLDSAYFPPPSAAPLPLFDVVTGVHVGWFCHAEHTPTVQIDWENVGACCIGDITCVTTDQANCEAKNGIFQGVGVPCDPNPCVQPADTGACCLQDGSCISTDPAGCQQAGGQFQGVGVPCTPDPCAPPPDSGACCVGDSCFISDSAKCEGNYKGDGTLCTQNTCDTTCCIDPGDADDGGAVNIGDATFIVKYIFQGGARPPCCDQADADGSDQLNIGDATFIVKFIFQDGSEPLCPSPGNLVCPHP